jgi:hypothetical protein
MRNAAMDAGLEVSLSTPRLTKYMGRSGLILDAALSLYERNGRLSEAFHTPLQCLEVCIRNHMNRYLDTAFGLNWFRNDVPPFEREAILKLNKAMDDVERTHRRLNQGNVVAELNFGFWVTILGRQYEETLWRPHFSNIFLEGGRRLPRQKVHNRLDNLRKLRNRVAHYEPIFHRNLANDYSDLIEAIGWICPDSAAWAIEHSRVPIILTTP